MSLNRVIGRVYSTLFQTRSVKWATSVSERWNNVEYTLSFARSQIIDTFGIKLNFFFSLLSTHLIVSPNRVMERVYSTFVSDMEREMSDSVSERQVSVSAETNCVYSLLRSISNYRYIRHQVTYFYLLSATNLIVSLNWAKERVYLTFVSEREREMSDKCQWATSVS